MKVHTALAATVARRAPAAVFGVMGDANMFLIDSLVRDYQLRYVAAANEAGAVLMGAGSSIRSGVAGFATVTYGPGLLNAVAALVSVARQRTPLVLITGETSESRPGHSQHIDQRTFAAAAGVGYARASAAENAVAELERAIDLALIERRPYVFACNVDFTFADCEVDRVSGVSPPPLPELDADELDRAVGVMATANRPLVLAGFGCVTSGAQKQVERLAAALGAPILTTLPAKGLLAGNEYHLGVCGTFSTPPAIDALQSSDCIVALGTSLDRLSGGGEGWPYFEGKRVVQCDVDPDAIRRVHPSDVGVVADVSDFASAVVEMLAEIDHEATRFRHQSRGGEARADTGAAGAADLATALTRIDAALPPKRMVTVDGGRFSAEAIARIGVSDARSWACSFTGFGAVGNALATAIGMGCAAADAPTVAVVGDGGFMLGGIAEFNTAVRYGVDLIVIVVNDHAYGAEYRKLQERGYDTAMSRFDWPSLPAVAAALGGAGMSITNPADLDDLENFLDTRKTPVLVEVTVQASQIG